MSSISQVEGLHSGVDVPPSTAQLQFSEEETQCQPVSDDCGAPKSERMAGNIGNCERDVAAASEEMQEDSTSQPIPGMSLSQNLQSQHHLHTDSDITTYEGESVPPDTVPVAILAAQSQHSAHSPIIVAQHSAQSPTIVAQHSAHSPTIVARCSAHSPTIVAQCSAHGSTVVVTSCQEERTAELKPTLLEDGMNLDLLDPLECNEEDPVPHDEGLKDIAQVNGPQSEKMLATNEDTSVNTSVITSIGDVTSTQSHDKLNTAAPLCPSITDTNNEIITTSDTHTRPRSAQAITSTPPPDSNIQQLDTVATSPIEKLTGVIHEYLHPEPSSKKNAREVSTTECGGSNSECMETGMEDVVVVGGDNGQLQLTSNSQCSDHIKVCIIYTWCVYS